MRLAALVLALLLVTAPTALAQPDWEAVDLGTTEDLLVLSRGSSRVYVAGANGFMSKADPSDYTSWTPSDMETTEDLISAIHVGSISSLFVSGDAGTVRYRGNEGAPWVSNDIPDAAQAYVVRRIATFTLAAFGSAGGIYTNQLSGNGIPTAWVQRTSGTSAALHDALTAGFPAVTLAVGDGGTLLRTEDSGDTWTSVASGTTADLHAVAQWGANWLVVGEGGLILKSADGGVTWTPRASGISSTLYALDDALSATRFLVAGANGTLLETEDFGETWCQHDVGTDATLYAVAAPTQQWLVAGEGGLMLRSQTQGGGACTPVASEGLPEAGVALSAPWPNPMSDRGTLSLSVDQPQHVRADLVDLLGRRVAALFDGPVNATEAVTLAVEVGGLAPGVYVVHVWGETFAATRRVTVAR